MVNELKPKAFGYSLGILSGFCMLILGILGNLGIYISAVEMMQKWHLFFSLSFLGIILGIIEALIMGYITGYLMAYIYNKFI